MTAYILRRLAYSVPLVLGANMLVFLLFFSIYSPEQMAVSILGTRAGEKDIKAWVQERGYDRPTWFNNKASGMDKIADTIFFSKFIRLLRFDFGESDQEKQRIGEEIRRKMIPSLGITVPSMVVGLLTNITFALFVALFRGTYLDFWATVLCVLGLSISQLFYIIGGQVWMGATLNVAPISGYHEGLAGIKFLVLPVVIGIVTGIGVGVRVNRTYFLEELGKDFIRTARAKGLSEVVVLYKHCLKNALIPIVTGVVAALPFLFMGNLVTEAFFAIPGLGGYTIEAIQSHDFAIIRAMVFLGSILTVTAFLLVDISYTIVDPRVRLR